MIGQNSLHYDYLVLATGAQHSYFGKDNWAANAPGLKTAEDAIEVRRRLLTAFERAESADGPKERAAWMTFVIVGGGPTGVELAGAIAELAGRGLEQEFRAIDPANATVVLIEAGPRLLAAFPPALSFDAATTLVGLGVMVRLDTKVEQVSAEGVALGAKSFPRAPCYGRPACRLLPRAHGWMPNGTRVAGSLSERISRSKDTTGSSRLAT